MRVRGATPDAAVEYHAPGEFPADRLCAPFELFADIEARKDDPVKLENAGDGSVTASWQDGNVPQLTQYTVDDVPGDAFPPLPTSTTSNPPRLLEALRDAMATTDDEALRYATDCIQLRGDGCLLATDGRQILLQNGFEFPWDDELLVPRNLVFGSKDLPGDKPVEVGNTEDWFTSTSGRGSSICGSTRTDDSRRSTI